MARIKQVRRDDGSLEPLRERDIAGSILRALAAAGTSDRALAEELAGVVVLFLDKYHGDDVPSLGDVEEMLCRVLRETGYRKAAEQFEQLNRDRRCLEDEVMVRTPAGDGGPFVTEVAAEVLRPWDRQVLVQSLIRGGELPAGFADEVAAEVEARILRSGLRSVTLGLIRELVDHELIERDLQPRREPPVVGVSQEEMAALAGGGISDRPDRYIAGRALACHALSRMHAEPVARAHHDGRLHIHGLDDPLKVERVELPVAVLFPDGFSDQPMGEILLETRTRLGSLRGMVRSSIVLPDFVGALSRHPHAHESPERLTELLLRALDWRDVYETADAPVVQLVVPLTVVEDASAAFLQTLCRRLHASAEQGRWLPASLAVGEGELPSSAVLEELLGNAAACEQAILHIRREGETPIFPGAAEAPVPLTISLGRVALNLPLAFLDAHGAGLKEVLPHLETVGKVARDAFHERFWYQRGGARWGLHGVVVGLGGPGQVQVHAQGQEVDLEVWGLTHALELLVRRGVIHPSRRTDAAARMLSALDYQLGEEVSGVRFRVRLAGALDRDVRRRMLGALDSTAERFGILDAQELVRDAALDRTTLPVAVPLLSQRNSPLLEAQFMERTGAGLALPLAAIGGDDPRTLLIRLRDETRLGLVTLAARSPGEDLFEVQEELFS